MAVKELGKMSVKERPPPPPGSIKESELALVVSSLLLVHVKQLCPTFNFASEMVINLTFETILLTSNPSQSCVAGTYIIQKKFTKNKSFSYIHYF